GRANRVPVRVGCVQLDVERTSGDLGRGAAGEPRDAPRERGLARYDDLDPAERAGVDLEGVARAVLRWIARELGLEADVSARMVGVARPVERHAARPAAAAHRDRWRRDPALAEAGELTEPHVAEEPGHKPAARSPRGDRHRHRNPDILILPQGRDVEGLENLA